MHAALQAAASGKPANIADKMVEGWLQKWCALGLLHSLPQRSRLTHARLRRQSEVCLLQQSFVMNDAVSVKARTIART